MTVSLPQANLSWLTQLGSIGKQQQHGSGYFPPAPTAAGASAAPATAGTAQQTAVPALYQPSAGGSFIQRLMQQVPANQAAQNPLYQPNMRLGG